MDEPMKGGNSRYGIADGRLGGYVPPPALGDHQPQQTATELMKCLVGTTEQLHQAISRLEDRLQPGLRAIPPDTISGVGAGNGSSPADSQLVADLHQIGQMVSMSIDRLNSLTRRVAL